MATIKQKLAYKEVVKGSTLSAAMRKVGYAPSTAERTNKLTRTKGWQELIDKNISEKALIKVHKEGLQATFTDKYNTNAPDFATRHKYLETGYKIRGKMKESDNQTTINNFNFFDADQLRKIASRTIDGDSESTPVSHRLSDSDEQEVRPELSS